MRSQIESRANRRAPRLSFLNLSVLAALLTTAEATAASPSLQDAVPPGHQIFEPLYAVSPFSMPTGMTCSPTGRYLYAGEGAAITVLDTSLGAWATQPLKTFQLTGQAIVPVEMVLDPDADVEAADPTQHADLLYIAAGRDGLWAIEADPRAAAVNLAFRVDDSPDGNPFDQSGRYYASALDFATIGEAQYLLVLFAAQDDSYLRIYDLEDLRDLVATATNPTLPNLPFETGFEIAPARNILLKDPANQPPIPPGDVLPFAYGLAVDHPVDSMGAPTGDADVYVAHGVHGILRVRLSPTAGVPTDVITAGPWFGNGSVYADPNHYNSTTQVHDYGFGTTAMPWNQAVYDDFKYFEGSTLLRSHPPLFTDVAVHNGFLYATVESAGWVRFDLSQTWSQAMPIDHHEGWQNQCVAAQCPGGETILRLLETDSVLESHPSYSDNRHLRTWSRRIIVSETASGAVLAVSTAPDRLRGHWFEQRVEGRTHQDPIATEGQARFDGHFPYTFLYRPDCTGFAPGVDNHELMYRVGGNHLLVPPDQGTTQCSETDWVVFFTGTRTQFSPAPLFPEEDPVELGGTGHNLFRVRVRWNGNSSVVTERTQADRRGRDVHFAATCLVDERVLFPGANDNGVEHPGVEWTCGPGTMQQGTPPTTFPPLPEEGLRGGVLMNGEAQWLHATAANKGYYFGHLQGRWAMQRYSVGTDICNPSSSTFAEPIREKYVRFNFPPDRFLDVGRLYYSSGGVFPSYDAWFASEENEPGAKIVFGVRNGTDWGVYVMRRDLLQGIVLENPGFATGSVHNLPSGATVATLVTAPELGNVPSATITHAYPDTNHFIRANDLLGATSNFFPRFFELEGDSPEVPVRYMLAVPAGRISVDGTESFMPLPAVAPFGQYKDHLKVCVYDLTDTTLLDPDGSQNLPAWTIIGPEPGFAADIKIKRFDGRVWLFVADFGGKLLVYDITDIRSQPHGGLEPGVGNFPPVATYTVRDSLTDTFASDLLSVVVDEVEWSDPVGECDGRLYVYLGASRVGVEVLRMRRSCEPGPLLEPLGVVQVAGEAGGLWIRNDPVTSQRQLVVGNTYGGIRILAYRP